MNYDIYCDESRQDLLAVPGLATNQNRFCCIGGILVPFDHRDSIKTSIKTLKDQHHVYGELRWGTVSNNKLAFYLELIDYFFNDPQLVFRVVVIDSTKIKNKTFNDADQELGYYKFYYQLLCHWLNSVDTYHIYTDQKTNRDKNRLVDLKRITNLAFIPSEPVKIIQAIDSCESLILQLENIIMGAVGYKYNYCGSGKSTAKEKVVATIESYLGRKIAHTPPYEPKFNVFVMSLKEGY